MRGLGSSAFIYKILKKKIVRFDQDRLLLVEIRIVCFDQDRLLWLKDRLLWLKRSSAFAPQDRLLSSGSSAFDRTHLTMSLYYQKITNFSATFLWFQQCSSQFSNILLISATFSLFQQHYFHFSNIPGYVAEKIFSNILSKVGVPQTNDDIYVYTPMGKC